MKISLIHASVTPQSNTWKERLFVFVIVSYSRVDHGKLICHSWQRLPPCGNHQKVCLFVFSFSRVTRFFTDEMMMSLLWYYRPEHTDIQETFINGEIYSSRHRDTNSVACIDDKCFVLTYNEYCRYKRQKVFQTGAYLQPDKTAMIVPHPKIQVMNDSRNRIPPLNTLPELVFCCRKVYDFRQKRILKNPTWKGCFCPLSFSSNAFLQKNETQPEFSHENLIYFDIYHFWKRSPSSYFFTPDPTAWGHKMPSGPKFQSNRLCSLWDSCEFHTHITCKC